MATAEGPIPTIKNVLLQLIYQELDFSHDSALGMGYTDVGTGVVTSLKVGMGKGRNDVGTGVTTIGIGY